MTITEMVDRCYQQAQEKGWNDRAIPVPEMIALLHSEASEALEEYREGMPLSYSKHGKPMGVGSEFADILIRIGHYSKLLGIDLEHEVQRKLLFNATREYRHGNKLA